MPYGYPYGTYGDAVNGVDYNSPSNPPSLDYSQWFGPNTWGYRNTLGTLNDDIGTFPWGAPRAQLPNYYDKAARTWMPLGNFPNDTPQFRFGNDVPLRDDFQGPREGGGGDNIQDLTPTDGMSQRERDLVTEAQERNLVANIQDRPISNLGAPWGSHQNNPSWVGYGGSGNSPAWQYNTDTGQAMQIPRATYVGPGVSGYSGPSAFATNYTGHFGDLSSNLPGSQSYTGNAGGDSRGYGGFVNAFRMASTGTRVPGAPSMADTEPYKLAKGEGVINAPAVAKLDAKYGTGWLHKVNSMGLHPHDKITGDFLGELGATKKGKK